MKFGTNEKNIFRFLRILVLEIWSILHWISEFVLCFHPQNPISFRLSPPSQLIFWYHWLAFLNQVQKFPSFSQESFTVQNTIQKTSVSLEGLHVVNWEKALQSRLRRPGCRPKPLPLFSNHSCPFPIHSLLPMVHHVANWVTPFPIASIPLKFFHIRPPPLLTCTRVRDNHHHQLKINQAYIEPGKFFQVFWVL